MTACQSLPRSSDTYVPATPISMPGLGQATFSMVDNYDASFDEGVRAFLLFVDDTFVLTATCVALATAPRSLPS